MTDYTNKIRQIKADLKTVAYDMTDDMFATALLHGLPSHFRIFKENYDWIRSMNANDPPDLDYLFDRLHVEEAKQIRLKEERKAKDRARKEASTSSPNTNIRYTGNQRPKREDKGHLKCNFPGCGKTGHIEDTCWTKDPSKMPRSFKDKASFNSDNKSIVGVVAERNRSTLNDPYSGADDLDVQC